jgi:hypothetical protein
LTQKKKEKSTGIEMLWSGVYNGHFSTWLFLGRLFFSHSTFDLISMRLAVYGGVSTTLAAAVILSAFTHRVNFYAACVYLSKSSACMMVSQVHYISLFLLSNGLYLFSLDLDEYGAFCLYYGRKVTSGCLLWKVTSH